MQKCLFIRKAVLFGLCLTAAAWGDSITLQNGDRISGTILEILNNKVSVQTEYAGTISVSLDAVVSLETTGNRAVALHEDTVLEGLLTVVDGKTGVQAQEEWHPIQPLQVLALADDREALEAALAPAPSRKWSGSLEAGLSLRSGNTDTTDAKVSAEIKRTGTRDSLKVRLEAVYGAADGTLNTRKYGGDVRWQVYTNDRMYLYTIGSAEHDDGRKLDLRLQGGGGLGYDVIKREKTTLAADIGFTYTYERWMPFTPWDADRLREDKRTAAFNQLYSLIPRLGEGKLGERIEDLRDIVANIQSPLRGYDTRTEDYPNLRAGINFKQTVFRTSTITEDLTVMPNLGDIGEFRALSEFAVTTPLTESLSLRTSLKSEYDSLARRKNVDAWDHTLLTTFRYSF